MENIIWVLELLIPKQKSCPKYVQMLIFELNLHFSIDLAKQMLYNSLIYFKKGTETKQWQSSKILE